MRFLMMGAGGVGGYFGGRLAAAGQDVGFVARGAHLDALRSRGLRVDSALGAFSVAPVRAESDPSALWSDGEPPDAVFVAVKLADTEGALPMLAPALGPRTAVISLQNGVEAEDLLARSFGAARVAGGVAYIAAAVEGPGVIRHIGVNQRIELGTLPGGEGLAGTLDRIVPALREAGADAARVDDIAAAIWRKFVFLVGLSAVTTVAGLPIGPIRADAEGRALLAAVMEEAAAVARARGVPLPADFAADRLRFVDSLPAEMRASMAHDFAAGKPLELDWLSGAVVRFGAALSVPTPVNGALAAAIRLRAQAR